MTLEQLRSERRRLRGILDSIPTAGVRIEAIEGAAALAGSTQLRQVLGELVAARAELRALRDRYLDDHPLVQDLLGRIRRLETGTIPNLIMALDDELAAREADVEYLLTATANELTNIPARTIEEGRLRRGVVIQETLYNNLRTRVEVARLAAVSSIPDVRVLDEARPLQSPVNSQGLKLFFLIFAGFLGAGVLAAFVLAHVDPRLRDPVQVENEMGMEVLGAIPSVGLPKAKAGDADRMLESFRALRLNIDYAYGRAGPQVITISSPDKNEGKTLIATNLAMAFANVGRRTLLIDADTRLGDAHKLLGVNRKPGLTDYLGGTAGKEIVQETSIPNLHFIGSGSRRASSPELVSAERMAALLAALKKAYATIIIDSPPLAAGGDAMALSAISGALAVVVRSGTTNRGMMSARLEALERFPVRVLGAVLNEFEVRGGDRYRYYSSYLPGYEARAEAEAEEGSTDGKPSPGRPGVALAGRP